MNNEIMDFKQACEYLRISKSRLYKLTSSRRIKFSKPIVNPMNFEFEM